MDCPKPTTAGLNPRGRFVRRPNARLSSEKSGGRTAVSPSNEVTLAQPHFGPQPTLLTKLGLTGGPVDERGKWFFRATARGRKASNCDSMMNLRRRGFPENRSRFPARAANGKIHPRDGLRCLKMLAFRESRQVSQNCHTGRSRVSRGKEKGPLRGPSDRHVGSGAVRP